MEATKSRRSEWPVPQSGTAALPRKCRTTSDHEFRTVAAVAGLLKCSEPTIRRRIRSGELPAVQVGGQRSAHGPSKLLLGIPAKLSGVGVAS